MPSEGDNFFLKYLQSVTQNGPTFELTTRIFSSMKMSKKRLNLTFFVRKNTLQGKEMLTQGEGVSSGGR
jgi:hypothetical protein